MPPTPLLSPTTLRALVLLAATLAGLLCAMISLTFVVTLDVGAWLAASLATAVMVRWTAALATRRTADPTDAALRTIGWGVLMGVLNVGMAFLAAMVVGPRPDLESIVLVPLAMLIGAPAGAFLGAAFGGLLMIPVASLMVAARRGTPSAADGAAAVVGAWVAVVAVIAMLPEPGDHSMFHLWPPSHDHEPFEVVHTVHLVWLRGAGLLVALGGMALTVLALDRSAARRRFVRRAAQGLLPRWRVEPLARPDEASTLPCLGGTPEVCGYALHRIEQPGDGAYRRAETSWPLARVPTRWVPTAARRGPATMAHRLHAR